ncbi:single-stranded-DNA-specific exonuclease RecJ [Longilinea arvoryzae]|uniref:Single-stranded-DNA-specific exonuclease RecJ n=1 Tax=Longilinea arvoryzae TaxID=360412 RepID=A0A0S7BB80_9CHLR|nr:single-stranded-DNA-specific exonuclease RecJ [Longilinea arvoryzae]GAP15023.1 single-stranded-DNA-specific exonuclease RecJ [Longilinea arvoryzae]
MTLPVDVLQWIEPEPIQAPDWALELTGGQPLAAQTLLRRGLDTRAKALPFLDRKYYTPTDAFSLPDMEKAVVRIEHALAQHERIGVWGDFDVDGQTATALLVSALRRLNADVVYHIPVRAVESHGVQLASLQTFLRQGIQVLLTCDTGVTAHESIDYAQNNGVDVVITDHHTLPETLPGAYAVVDSQRVGPENPLSTLCGVGTAFKLVEALFVRAGLAGELENYTDLAALGSIADLAALRGETRYLVQRGLDRMRAAPRPALRAMLEHAGVEGDYLTESHISFQLAPALNAIGRLEDANPVVEFFLSADPALINVTAARLDGFNSRRKLLTDQVFQAAQSQIQQNPDLLRQPALVLSHANWPAGVIGIVASRLVELYHRPTLLLSTPEGQVARGSARSIEGVNITAAIASGGELLANFGGHPMAAGLGLHPENLPAFQRRLNRAILDQTGGKPLVQQLEVDGYLDLNAIDLALVESLDRLAPFGAGNPPLTLASRDLRILSETPVGRNGEHVQLVVEAPDGASRKVIWWQGAGLPRPDGPFDLAYTLSASNFRGQAQVQMEWLHARPIEREKPVEIQHAKAAYRIADLRADADPEFTLTHLPPADERMVWAEGEIPGKCGLGRHKLQSASELVIFTCPPGPRELAGVLERVQPEKVTLLAYSPSGDDPEAFKRRLAGLLIFALKHREGRTSLVELAAATAQRESTIRAGLDWLAAHGDIRFTLDETGQVQLTGGGISDEGAQQTAMRRITILLDETAAYRAYYRRADPAWLLMPAAPSATKSRRDH